MKFSLSSFSVLIAIISVCIFYLQFPDSVRKVTMCFLDFSINDSFFIVFGMQDNYFQLSCMRVDDCYCSRYIL